jgi:hypothetical protein
MDATDARGHGWLGAMLTPAQLEASLAGLATAATEVERPPHLGPLGVALLVATPVTPAEARAHAALGVDDLLVYPLPVESVDDVERALEGHAHLID